MKVFKKQTTILVAVICFCLLFSVSALAEVCGDFEYVVTGDNTCKITGYMGLNGDIVIPSIIEGKEVRDFNPKIFNSSTTSIIFPDTIDEIELEIFCDLKNLKKIVFQGDIQVFGDYYTCNSVEEIYFNGNVVFKGDGCFFGYTALKRVVFSHAGEVCFGVDTFARCPKLREVLLQNESVCIGLDEGCFEKCSAIEEMVIPISGSIEIGAYCFRNCTGLKKVILRGGSAKIELSAFENCSVLTDLLMDDGYDSIGNRAFYGCKNLNNLIIGEGYSSIDDEAFRGCSKLASIILPSSIETMSETAFFGCNATLYTKIGSKTAVSLSRAGYTFMDPDYPGISLKHTFNQNEVSGFEVVSADTGMASAVIPQSVTAVGKSAFSGCTLLNHVSFPESLSEIGQSAFYDCRRLKEVYIPETVTSIGDSAFNPNTTIYCYEYTVAEAWANRNGFKVILLDQKPFEEIGRITLPEELYVQNGTQKTVTAEIFPNTPDLVPVWTSSDPTVATVSEDGNLLALRNGETTLTLTVKGKTAQCIVHVVTMAEDFTIPAELYVQAKKSIAAPVPAVMPEDATVHLEWSADNALAVEISPAGSITGYVVGDTVLTAKDTISGLTKTATLHIVRPVSAISVTPAAAGLIPYEPLQLTAQGRIGTTEIGEVGVTWTSENPSVAVADESGRVQALAPGRTRIVATFDGRATAACTLTVREAATIRLPASLKTVSANALAGTTAELYILPDSVERIESGAFANLHCARVIVIPEGAAAGTEADAFAETDAILVHPDGTPFEP